MIRAYGCLLAAVSKLFPPNFFLDKPGGGAKMNTPIFQEFNMGVFAFRSPHLRLSHSVGNHIENPKPGAG